VTRLATSRQCYRFPIRFSLHGRDGTHRQSNRDWTAIHHARYETTSLRSHTGQELDVKCQLIGYCKLTVISFTKKFGHHVKFNNK